MERPLLPVGSISKVFGSAGGLVVKLYDTCPGDIDTEEPLFVLVDALAVPLFICSFSPRGRGGALVEFDDIDTPARAASLVGHEIFIRSEESRTDGENATLTGYTVVITTSSVRATGVVCEVVESEMNPLIVVRVDGREVMIPLADELVTRIDRKRRRIEMDLPDGLLDLN